MGEEDSESSQPMEEHKLLRRTGLQEDQDAVESVKSGMRQFSSGSKRKAVNKPRKINISDIPMEHRLREAPGGGRHQHSPAAQHSGHLPHTDVDSKHYADIWVGYSGGLYSASTGRSFQQETARMD